MLMLSCLLDDYATTHTLDNGEKSTDRVPVRCQRWAGVGAFQWISR